MSGSGLGLFNYVIAALIGVVIWRSSLAMIRMLGTPPDEVDPDDVQPADQGFLCTVCGTEVVMTMSNVAGETAPRHCREDMVPVWRPDA